MLESDVKVRHVLIRFYMRMPSIDYCFMICEHLLLGFSIPEVYNQVMTSTCTSTALHLSIVCRNIFPT